jgi:hypothetical protein
MLKYTDRLYYGEEFGILLAGDPAKDASSAIQESITWKVREK